MMTMIDHRVPEPAYGPDVPMPRIYVASLSDYNAGRLHGEWIDANQTADEIQADVEAMLACSPERVTCQWCGRRFRTVTGGRFGGWKVHTEEPADRYGERRLHLAEGAAAEEWAIHDYEGFGPLGIGEWESFETVAALAEGYNDHGEAFFAYVDHNGGLEYAADFEEAYCGEWRSIGEYAEEAMSVADGSWPYGCVDWERAGRELEMGGDNYTVDSGAGTVYVFRAT